MTTLLDRVQPDFGSAVGLACRECGRPAGLAPVHVCADCFGPLEVVYRAGGLSREAITAGPPTLWRYAPLLPAPPPAQRVDLQAGLTRLRPAANLARRLGMRQLWVKDDTANPTHSFKDRVVGVAASAARAFGFDTICAASTGNLANAVAAAAAHAGMRAVVFVPRGLESAKVLATGVYGATVVAVDGSYDDANRLCAEVAEEMPWAFVNLNLRPFYAEGSKTVGFEIAEQLGWRLPAQVVVPVASGSLLTKIDKAWTELVAAGLVPASPYRVFGAQSAGCAPVATAFATGAEAVTPVRPSGIVKSLAIGNPADAPYALKAVRRTGGAVLAVGDPEVVEAMRLLAGTEGVFGETAGGVTLATLRRGLAEGRLDPDAETVLVNTGDGLKTLDALGAEGGPARVIEPTLAAFRRAGIG